MSMTTIVDQLKSIERAPDGGLDKANAEKIKSLAAQFESMLVGQMMQQMRSSMFESDGEGEDKSAAPLADAMFAELSLALSRAGGMGLADALIAPLARQAGGGAPASAIELSAASAFSSRGDASALEAAPAPTTATPALAGRMSSAYGWRKDPIDDSVKFHRGMDIAMPVGRDVPAPQAGRVIFAGEQPGYGLTVVLDHGGELTTRYAHLSEIEVGVGDDVPAGQVIAKSGATGRVTGPHLHFEVMEAGKTVNPAEKLATYTAGRPQ